MKTRGLVWSRKADAKQNSRCTERDRESERGREHDFPITLMQTCEFSLLLFLDCWHFSLALCFGWDPPSYSAPKWKVFCIWRQSIVEYWKQVSCRCIYQIKNIAHSVHHVWNLHKIPCLSGCDLKYVLLCNLSLHVCLFMLLLCARHISVGKAGFSRKIYRMNPCQEITI